MREAGHPFGLYDDPHDFKRQRMSEVGVWALLRAMRLCSGYEAFDIETEAPSSAHDSSEESGEVYFVFL